ncbi:hypothetical protein [Actinomadura rifamycini]|uniref:hypothetical protein n=1 Tax=Actinomadura rifamycini TaxID=31962 RepID=UPI000407D558|nr:hypothetical protein [Actinomadura rifamycini]
MKPTARERAERAAARSAGRGLRGRWAGLRLFATARRTSDRSRAAIVRIARTPDHRLRERARLLIADWWGAEHDSRVRQAVVETGAVAGEGFARLRTLALLGRLGESWGEPDVGQVRRLLADHDPDVRRNAAAACREAAGPVFEALWDEALWNEALWNGSAGAHDALAELLLRRDAPPPVPHRDRLWRRWLADPAGPLGDALFRWALPLSDVRPVAAALDGVRPGAPCEPPQRAALLYALLLGDAPLRDAAASRLTAPLGEEFDGKFDEEFVEELCERVLLRPDAAGFCVERGLAPRDPVRRALFYVVTRQPGQHRALDPDGGLLSLAYASAPPAVRSRVRDAMVANGELDLVRVIVGDGPRARASRLPDEDARYLAERLAERREWDEFWAFVRDLPVAAAAGLVRLAGGWAPRGEDERRYFRALRDADPATVEEGVARLVERPPLEPYAVLRFPRHWILDLSFSPGRPAPGGTGGGPRLAVASIRHGVSVLDLGTARVVESYEEHGPRLDRVLHVGDGVVAQVRSFDGSEHRLIRCADGAARTLRTTASPVTSLVLTGDDGGFAACTAEGELLLGGPGGDVRALAPAAFGIGGDPPPDRIGAHRGTGRIVALGDRADLHLIEPGSRSATALRTAEPVVGAAFLDADTLVCKLKSGTVARMSLPDGRTGPPARTKQFGPGSPHALPRTGEAVFMCVYGDLHVYGGDPPERVQVRSSPDDESGRLAVSPDGSLLAAGYRDGRIDLFDLRPRELAAVVRGPVAGLAPRHLRLVTECLGGTAFPAATRAALDLLRTALEHRFRFDVEVGGAVRLAAGEHDIGL